MKEKKKIGIIDKTKILFINNRLFSLQKVKRLIINNFKKIKLCEILIFIKKQLKLPKFGNNQKKANSFITKINNKYQILKMKKF